MKPTQVVALVAAIQYKPGWKIWAVEQSQAIEVRVRVRFRDTRPPFKPVVLEDVRYMGPTRIAMQRRPVERWLLATVRKMIVGLEQHEIDERLFYRGSKPFNPHRWR